MKTAGEWEGKRFHAGSGGLGLLTENLAALMNEGLVQIQRVAQDGMRVRAHAGASSFRRQPTLQRCLDEARAQMAALENQLHEDGGAATRRQEAARQRGKWLIVLVA